MADAHATEEFEQILQGTLAYLRTVAARELDYPAVVRIERAAYRRSRVLLDELGLGDAEPRQETDELLDEVVSQRRGRQSVTEQVLGWAAGGAEDEGPEGVADDAHQDVSDEVTTLAGGDEEAFEELADEEAFEEIAAEEEEEDEDEDTAEPGTPVPGRRPAPAAVEAEPEMEELEAVEDLEEEEEAIEAAPDVEPDLDLDAMEEVPETEGDDATGEVPRPGARGPLLPDFDFDDEGEEQDETVVFAMGSGKTADEVARMLGEATDPEVQEESFDLMPELAGEEAEEEGEEADELELELEEELAVDDTDDEMPAPLDFGSNAPASDRRGAALKADPTPPARATPAPAARAGARAAPAAVAAVGGRASASARAAVPTIRESHDPAPPRAAAIQVNAKSGTGKMMGFEEEEEPLEIGSAEDYGEEEDDNDGGGGFSLNIQEYESAVEEVEEEEEEEEPEPVKPVYRGPDQGQVRGMLSKAREAADRGDMQAGVELFSDVLDADPDSIDAYVGRGRLYLDLGDYSRAMSDFMTAEDLAPQSPEPQVAIGDLYFARKDYRKAIDYFNEALNLDKNHAMAHCRRGISHYYRKNYQEALVDLEKAEKMDADIPNIGTYIAMAKKKAKK